MIAAVYTTPLLFVINRLYRDKHLHTQKELTTIEPTFTMSNGEFILLYIKRCILVNHLGYLGTLDFSNEDIAHSYFDNIVRYMDMVIAYSNGSSLFHDSNGMCNFKFVIHTWYI